MKETALQLTALINSYIEEDNLDKLNNISVDIENCIGNLLLISDNSFTAIVITRFFNPISIHIENLNKVRYSGRYQKQKEEDRVNKLGLTVSLKNKIINDYKEKFKQTESYREFVFEESNRRDFILNPFHKSVPIDLV